MAGDKLYAPGKRVPTSGIYEVVHKGHIMSGHQITCVATRRFPPYGCTDCKKDVRFRLKTAAKHWREDDQFRKSK
jgi:hypothetical protein